MGKQHQISKSDIRTAAWAEVDSPELADGEARLRIEAFALTANNVTYAAFGGPPMHYWNFFPASDDSFGRVPVWGFATVAESKADGVAEGQRVYGYFPISEDLVVQPVRTSERGFMDGAPPRQGLAPIYNAYVYTANDPAYVEGTEPEQMLFRPLYMTGWMICDSLMNDGTPPESVVISSASSKTAIATAHGLKRRDIRTVGVTSPRNVGFVKQTGLYDEVLTYDSVSDHKPDSTVAYVDFVGRPALTRDVHVACGDKLIRSMLIGATDWETDRAPIADLPGPQPILFFVPDYAANRAKQLPPGELDKMTGKDLVAFYPISRTFVTPKTVSGAEAIAQAWRDTVDANVPADQGLICSF